MSKLSLIITAYDHHDLTVEHVKQVMRCQKVPDEIIVVNDGGTHDLKDKLLNEIGRQGEFCRSQLLDGKTTKLIYARIDEDILWNYNGACNLGTWLSTGDLVSFEDNDNLPSPEFYEQAISLLSDPRNNIGRVIARKRYDINNLETKEVIGKRGPNQGTYMIKREVLLNLKGQDEKFCGRYGWMYYDWRRRMLRSGIDFGMAGYYYYYVDGQSNIPHKNDKANYSILRHNTRREKLQSSGGILNFTYTWEVL